MLLALMRRHPFATLVGVRDGSPEIAHIPLLAKDAPLRIAGHVARGNPLARMVESGARLTAVFHGPHAYVSPRLYRTTPNVPTWNYAVVHASGPAKAVDGGAMDHLRELIDVFEAGRPQGEAAWSVDSVAEHAARILPGLVAFEISVERVEGKFKLNQNRKAEDWAGVVARFEESDDPVERELLALMKQLGPPG